jgi:putative copper export protein
VLDEGVRTIDIDVIRVTLHVLAATVWVGGQIVLAALIGPLHRAAPEGVAPVARAYAWVAWPAFAVLVLTGFWSMTASGLMVDPASRATILVKLALVLLSGLGAALHTFAKGHALKGIGGAVGLVGALAALLLGVAL